MKLVETDWSVCITNGRWRGRAPSNSLRTMLEDRLAQTRFPEPLSNSKPQAFFPLCLFPTFRVPPQNICILQPRNAHANSFVPRHQLSKKIHFQIKHSTDTSRIRLTTSWRDPSAVPAKAMLPLRARALATEPATTPMEATAPTIPLLVHPPMAKLVTTGPMAALRSAREDTERVHQLPPLRRGPVV